MPILRRWGLALALVGALCACVPTPEPTQPTAVPTHTATFAPSATRAQPTLRSPEITATPRPSPTVLPSQQPGALPSETTSPWSTTSATPSPAPSASPTTAWKTYASPRLGVTLRYPAHWQTLPGYEARYGAADGFVQLSALSSGGRTLAELCQADVQHQLQPYGSQPQVLSWPVQDRPGCLILPSADQLKEMQRQAGLIAPYPRPLRIGSASYDHLVLWADAEHIQAIAQSLSFSGF
jgi:hypothetical protein